MELGINFFDTANVYGWKTGEGITEQIVGRWFAQGGGRREKVVIATKVFGRMGDWPNERFLSAYHIRRACEESLRRLQTDHIDLYQMHHIDRSTPWEEVWQAHGSAGAAGQSDLRGQQQLRRLAHRAGARDGQSAPLHGLGSEQSLYNLRERSIELEVIPACRAYGLGVIPWSPLDGGMLGGMLQKAKEGRRANPDLQKRAKPYLPKIRAYEAKCKVWEEKPADVALAWLLHNPIVTAPIIGPRTLEQLDGSLRALKIKLTKTQLEELDQIFPGPGGEAPEAYAW